jgi:hypothetical protein
MLPEILVVIGLALITIGIIMFAYLVSGTIKLVRRMKQVEKLVIVQVKLINSFALENRQELFRCKRCNYSPIQETIERLQDK